MAYEPVVPAIQSDESLAIHGWDAAGNDFEQVIRRDTSMIPVQIIILQHLAVISTVRARVHFKQHSGPPWWSAHCRRIRPRCPKVPCAAQTPNGDVTSPRTSRYAICPLAQTALTACGALLLHQFPF